VRKLAVINFISLDGVMQAPGRFSMADLLLLAGVSTRTV
jgi:hypothetical protein